MRRYISRVRLVVALVAAASLMCEPAFSQNVKSRKQREAEEAEAKTEEAKEKKAAEKKAAAAKKNAAKKETPKAEPGAAPEAQKTTPAKAPPPAAPGKAPSPAPTAAPSAASPATSAESLPPAIDLESLIAKHVGTGVTVVSDKERSFVGSFSGTGSRDIAVLVKPTGNVSDLNPKVKVDHAFEAKGDRERTALSESAKDLKVDEASFLQLALVFMHGAKGKTPGSGQVRILLDVQRAGLSGELQVGTFKKLAHSPHLKGIGCEFDAIRIITESSAALYVCFVKDKYEILADPDDQP